jgi:hypothetical protein
MSTKGRGGATTLGITTLSIMTLAIMTLSITRYMFVLSSVKLSVI